MEYRRLGGSGLKVSAVGLGTNNIGGRTDEAQSARVLDQAVEAGINFIDTSNTYSRTLSEQIIGKWMKGKRDKVIIATKFGKPVRPGPYGHGASRMHIMQEVDGSLQRLQTDYIDLYQQHEPDPESPIEETLRALDDLARMGKIRYIGTSNFASWQIVEAAWAAKVAGTVSFVSEQPHYSLLEREVDKEISGVCLKYGIGLIPFYPLEGGLLTGKYKRGEAPPAGTRIAGRSAAAQQSVLSEHNFDRLERLESFAEKYEHGLTDLAIAWLLANPMVSSVIAGATRPEQVTENVKGVEWRLTAEDLGEIDDIVPVG